MESLFTPSYCDGEIRDDEPWDEAAEIDYNRYLETFLKIEDIKEDKRLLLLLIIFPAPSGSRNY